MVERSLEASFLHTVPFQGEAADGPAAFNRLALRALSAFLDGVAMSSLCPIGSTLKRREKSEGGPTVVCHVAKTD